jgi:hypothetical protein
LVHFQNYVSHHQLHLRWLPLLKLEISFNGKLKESVEIWSLTYVSTFSINFRSQIENQMSEYRLLGTSSLNCVVVNMNFIYLPVIKYVIHYVVVYFIKSCNYPEHDHIYLSSSLGVIPSLMISYTIYRFTILDLITSNTYQKLYANRRVFVIVIVW